jgi:hypothetical protein
MKFRKKPVVIEAIQYGPYTAPTLELAVFLDGVGAYVTENGIIIPTLEGDHLAQVGDWIIKGVKGEFYPCRADIFELTYEPADQAVAGAALDCVCGMGFGPCKDPECKAPILAQKGDSHELPDQP